MKKAIITALLAIALPLVSQAQKQTFNLPSFFSTNVYLFDNTNLPLHLRISGSAVSNVQDWAALAAVTNINVNDYDLDNVGGIDFDTTPTGTIAAARMQWSPDFETVRLGLDAAVSLDIGQQQVALVRNAESVTISNGMVVYIAGASGDKASVKIASYSNDTLSARTIGIAAEDIVSGGTGFVVTRGPVYAQNTSAFTAGAMLYLGAYGNVTTNRPSAPLHGVFVGVVEKVNANAGVIYVAVQNGFEMDELHDVNVASVTSGQVLQYNGTVWTNANAAYLPLAGGAMAGNINMGENQITNVSVVGLFSDGNRSIDFEDGSISGNYNPGGTWTFDQQPTIPGYINTNNLSTIAGSGLGVTNNQLVVTNVAGGDASGWSGFAATQNVNMAGNFVTNIGATGISIGQGGNIDLKDGGINNVGTITGGAGIYEFAFDAGQIDGPWAYTTQPTFPNPLLSISSAISNYWRIATVPASNTAFGQRGQIAISNTNIFIYEATSSKWLRVNGTLEW